MLYSTVDLGHECRRSSCISGSSGSLDQDLKVDLDKRDISYFINFDLDLKVDLVEQ